ncbi:amino acid adenylation domain-containing protein [Jatrophihabitans telluris]|uniref:Amino acid adenylation domain-containing protein n=1 Tax=Jatrophihabitans telluris TaxID=2038343 RepID=A0ABY4QXV8_9ACTN|nr:Pls/PosA family non-ribosomal peptide synthetase [Jatrophihabitans telluris]UQX87735.1 amino acid adenylation domain-containing protein [Jatrophihabitans telluris]
MTDTQFRPQLSRVAAAPPPRTLLDVFAATVAAHPHEAALDDGRSTLSYAELLLAAETRAEQLRLAGVRRGDRVGVRLPSGTHDLYIAILGILAAGAAYVPVDADDPEDRARLVFGEAGVVTVIDGRPESAVLEPVAPSRPELDDDAWIIFTSGSTGTPKGVAVSHRSAAAFVDAEARLFRQDEPLGPGDRVLAGLSVAFDASCEEMWLAWRNGACLVPAPRSLVRSGMDLGPWLVEHDITVVSTVPTLAGLWPPDCLDGVRLLIFGGEACPPELAERLVDDGREVWNTYGPTEATVVACAAPLSEDGPVRIGLPLDGWDLAVVDGSGRPVGSGEIGELIIGGVGLARYLDPVKDAEKFAPFPSLGWERAYRSGDLVRYDPEGLLFIGRADEQVKLGGRRIELGEVDAALQSLTGVVAAAAAVRTTKAGNQILVGYLVTSASGDFDQPTALARLREALPAALVPMLAVVETLPTRISGKVDRNALPWPLAAAGTDAASHGLTGTIGWLADQWSEVLGANVLGGDDDFFAHGGGSLAAAQLVSRLRQRFPHATVANIYDHPRLADLADLLDSAAPAAATQERLVRPMPRRAQGVQLVITLLVNTLAGLRWLTFLAAVNNIVSWSRSLSWAPTVSWWWVLAGFVLFISPPGRMAIAIVGTRILLVGLRPGRHPRGGSVHLRIWAAERLAEAVDAANLAGAPWIAYYARALGASIGPGVTLHTLPPITGMLTIHRDASVEPEVDLAGYWIDGDEVIVGTMEIGIGATIGSRSTLAPGVRIGHGAEIASGSWVFGQVGDDERWAGSPAAHVGRARHRWPAQDPPRKPAWMLAYGAASTLFSALPLLAALPGLWWAAAILGHPPRLSSAIGSLILAVPAVTLTWLLCYASATVVIVRLLGLGLREGHHPVRSRIGWQAWATERVMDSARSLLFPIYSSLFTPLWLRALGAHIGKGVEASTVLLLPSMTTVGDGAFLADDTMVASYELGGGWVHIAAAKIGKRAFLGNSGMAAPGRTVPKNALVAVLSAAPRKASKGSSWLGSPPVQLRRAASAGDASRTFAPPAHLKLARAAVELCRIVPVMVTVALGLALLLAYEALAGAYGWWVAALLSGIGLLAAGAVAGAVTSAAKWLLVGRTRAVEYPLWSSFVWRNEVVDTFVEVLAAPWFARAATGTVVLNVWLRSLGSRIGRGVWLETYWLPEADLIEIGDGATVNRGCVLQTHLFHDRILRMDTVMLGAGATMGPHGVILPGASIGAGGTVGPASLVMRGEAVPASTRWIGNPISPWTAEHSGDVLTSGPVA